MSLVLMNAADFLVMFGGATDIGLSEDRRWGVIHTTGRRPFADVALGRLVDELDRAAAAPNERAKAQHRAALVKHGRKRARWS